MAESPQSGQHVFTPIAHPELRQIGQKHIHVFFRELESYFLRIQDAVNSIGNIEPISPKASVDSDFSKRSLSLTSSDMKLRLWKSSPTTCFLIG